MIMISQQEPSLKHDLPRLVEERLDKPWSLIHVQDHCRNLSSISFASPQDPKMNDTQNENQHQQVMRACMQRELSRQLNTRSNQITGEKTVVV